MRLPVAAVVLACVRVAAADPVPPARCSVTIAHAPDEVRAVIETWLRAEPHCRGDLEVRVIPTEGGLYLFARDGEGRVRERLVPDAQSAGLLVTSWVADDGYEPAREVSRPAGSVMQSPIMTPPIDRVVAVGPPAATSPVVLTVGAMMLGGLTGLRLDLDMTRRGRFVFGASIGLTGTRVDNDMASLSSRELDAIVYAAVPFHYGRFWFRPQLGVGGIAADLTGLVSDPSDPLFFIRTAGSDGGAVIEGSLRLGADLGDWTVSAGPVARYFQLVFSTDDGGSFARRSDLSLLVGVGHRL